MFAIDHVNEDDFVDFETFRRLVGASWGATKEAIEAIPVEPFVPLSDRRRKLYPKNRVAEVQRYVREHMIN